LYVSANTDFRRDENRVTGGSVEHTNFLELFLPYTYNLEYAPLTYFKAFIPILTFQTEALHSYD
jgi:hypothetical protein